MIFARIFFIIHERRRQLRLSAIHREEVNLAFAGFIRRFPLYCPGDAVDTVTPPSTSTHGSKRCSQRGVMSVICGTVTVAVARLRAAAALKLRCGSVDLTLSFMISVGIVEC